MDRFPPATSRPPATHHTPPSRTRARCRWAALALWLLPSTARAGTDALCLTANARGNQNLPVAFTVQPETARCLFDGSHLDRHSAGFPQNTEVVVRFAEPVRLARVSVVTYNDPERSYNAALRGRALARLGERQVASSPWVALDADALVLCGTDDHLVLGNESLLPLPNAGACDTLTLVFEKKPDAHQCLVREVSVWGIPERLASAPRAPLRVQAAENTYSSIRVSWPSLPRGASYLRVRHRRQGEAAWQTTCFTASPGLLRWLRPAATYEVTAEAVGVVGSGNTVSRQVRLPHPLEQRTMADAFGMNFYPGGGGAHQAHTDETENTRRMIRLMRAAGVRHVRWWMPSPGAALLFAEAGMALMPHATFTDPADYRRLAETTGAWLTATQNEPDFAHTFAEEFVRAFAPTRAAARRFSPLMLLAGPAVGGELVGPGTDYLAAAYAAGLREAVDVLDLHPYGKVSTPLSRGGILGAPEGLLASLAACRELLRRVGDPERPILASESGHPTYEGAWHMPPSSYQRQAQWLVRTHLLLIASGVRRIFWYAFQDEGTDRRNPEHCFGIVDWHGKPKPAYTAYRTMTRLLGATRCEGLEAALKPPLYGVRCARPGGYITVLWDGGGRGEVRLGPDSGITQVLSLSGTKLPLPRRSGGALVLPVDESVRYVYSTRPLRYLAQRRLSPPVAPRVHLTLRPSTLQVQPGRRTQWQAHLTSEFPCPVRVTLECGHPWQGTPATQALTLTPRGRGVATLALDVPADLKPQIVSWDLRCHYQPAEARYHPGEFRRALFFMVKENTPPAPP